MLIDIVSLSFIVLNLIDGDAAELAEEVDVLSGLQMGKTQVHSVFLIVDVVIIIRQVFMRAPVFELLERLHIRSLTVIAKQLQRRWRNVLAHRHAAARKGSAAKAIAGDVVMYSALLRRVKARKCVSATLVLQRRLRVFLAVCRLRRAVRGFTLLKAQYRGQKARQRVRQLKYAAARRVQSCVRGYLQVKKYRAMRTSALVLQTTTRMYLAYMTRVRKVRLIRLLQRLWRGTMARIQTYILRQKLVGAVVSCSCLLCLPVPFMSVLVCASLTIAIFHSVI